MNEIRLSGNWEAWLDFFAEAVIVTATQAVDTARQLIDLANGDRDRISGLGRAAASTLRVHRAMMGRPITASGWLVKKTGITPATVNKCLGHLERLGIVRERIVCMRIVTACPGVGPDPIAAYEARSLRASSTVSLMGINDVKPLISKIS